MTVPDGERRTVRRLLAALAAKQYTVHTNVQWMARASEPSARMQGEMDVVICHAEKGVLVLEVKGGGIELDLQRKQWWSTDRYGRRRQIQDPMRQAQASARHLIDLMHNDSILSDGGRGFLLPIGSAVVFPDLDWKRKLVLHYPDELVIDQGDLDRAREHIDAAFDYWAQRTGRRGTLQAPQWRHLNWRLSPHEVRPISLAATLSSEAESFADLTNEQLRVLQAFQAFPRLKVAGCAGSGKTMLALAEVERLAKAGDNVLLLCYNRLLGAALARETEGTASICACNFHEFCRRIYAEQGLEAPEVPSGADEAEFWKVRFPEMAFGKLDTFAQRFDAVVVDEGQDFRPDWWVLLEALLKPDGRFVVFYDPNQDIFEAGATIPIELPPVMLTRNCRSTAAINRAARAVGQITFPSEDGPVEGEPPAVAAATTLNAVRKELASELERVIGKGGVSNRNVAILSSRRLDHSSLAGVHAIGRYQLTEDEPKSEVEVRFATLQRYKGLEADVIFLLDVDLDHVTCVPKNLYVAFSRAKHRLFVWVKEEHVARLRDLLSQPVAGP